VREHGRGGVWYAEWPAPIGRGGLGANWEDCLSARAERFARAAPARSRILQDNGTGVKSRTRQAAVDALAMMRSMLSGAKNSGTGTVPAMTLTNWSIAAWLVWTALRSCCS
jgi:hypothetical protein